MRGGGPGRANLAEEEESDENVANESWDNLLRIVPKNFLTDFLTTTFSCAISVGVNLMSRLLCVIDSSACIKGVQKAGGVAICRLNAYKTIALQNFANIKKKVQRT